LSALVAVVAVAQTGSLVTYDDSSGSFISPAKWNVFALCATPTTYDCVREQGDEALRLGLRAYSSNT